MTRHNYNQRILCKKKEEEEKNGSLLFETSHSNRLIYEHFTTHDLSRKVTLIIEKNEKLLLTGTRIDIRRIRTRVTRALKSPSTDTLRTRHSTLLQLLAVPPQRENSARSPRAAGKIPTGICV